MFSGAVATVVVCDPAATVSIVVMGGANQPRCVLPDGRTGLLVGRDAYLLASSSQASVEALSVPFDYVYASGIWAFAFSTVVGLYVMTHGIGHVLAMIRRG